jgi:hypothetical protein
VILTVESRLVMREPGRANRTTRRPLEAWWALFFDAGFVLEDLREPRPTSQDASGDPGLAKNRGRPAFLHLRCRLR